MRDHLIRCAAALSLAVVAAGCDELFAPPFNATGSFSGTWRTQDLSDMQVTGCPITFTLRHTISGDVLESTQVSGTVTLDFSCFELAQSLIDFGILEIGTLEVEGYVLPGGTMELHTKDLFSCSGNECFRFVALGIGADSDGDGGLDGFEGDWDALAMLGGVAPFPLNGNFAVMLAAEE
ncbi:MAG: hypothetical protein HYV27_02040 [Candidatus Hydrogenedentes bacterium]|nr:hypothetical protein [Candidatus Hydrogenedentota bacterium]